MGVSVVDMWRKKKVTRCPVESPPGVVLIKLEKELDGDVTTKSISKTVDDDLVTEALVSESAFHTEALGLGTFYTDLRTLVVVGPTTYDERTEFWKMYKDDIT